MTRNKILPDPINIKDGCGIYMQYGSPYWYAKYRTAEGWQYKSTKTTNEHEAIGIALNLFNNPPKRRERIRKKRAHKFSYWADAYRDSLDLKPKPIHASYLSGLHKWVEPFFGNMRITEIDDDTLHDYENWRTNKPGGNLCFETVKMHHTVIKAVLLIAAKQGAISRAQIPTTFTEFNTGHGSDPRSTFTHTEYDRIYRTLRYWHKDKEPASLRHRCQLLREYVLILANTGMRPGREPLTLKWKNIDLNWVHPVTKKTHIRIHVKYGKKGDRPLIAREAVRRPLERLKALTGYTKPDDYVFAMPDGSRARRMDELFKNFLIEHDLREDLKGNERTLYSLRHMYITNQILHDQIPLIVIAKNCGTSVAIIEKTYAKIAPEAFAAMLSA